MKALIISTTILLAASPLMAQEAGGPNARGYVTGLGGFSVALGSSTGQTMLEGGIRIAPHVMVFGNLGHYANLQGELQPTLDATTASLATSQGLGVTTTGSLPATYGIGGVRLELPIGKHLMPYVLGGVGVARLTPTATLSYQSGFLPDGSTPDVGTDITSTVTSAGVFTAPAASRALMTTLGGGVQVPVTQHWIIDAGYRYARVAADTTLSASPLNTNGMAFGFGYRF